MSFKKLIIFIFILFFAKTGLCENIQVMTITLLNGQTNSIPMRNEPKIRIENNQFLIEVDNQEISYDLQQVNKLEYHYLDDSGVQEIMCEEKDPQQYEINKDELRFLSSIKDRQVAISLPNGLLEKKFIIPANESYSIKLRDLSGGLHLLTINNKTYKIML